jgi:predicted  nucleic acid-binding Zn-ribbon protein
LQRALQLLIELQQVERRIRTLSDQQARAPKQLAALEEELRSAESRRDRERELLESARKARRQTETAVEELEQRAKKSRERLASVKTNKEYQALLKEIEDLQGLVRQREDQILEQMEVAERHHAIFEDEERAVARARERLEAEGAEIQGERVKADAQMVVLRKEQEELTPQIPTDLLQTYRVLIIHRSGIAVAPVSQGACQMCHMNLPPQLFIDLQKDEQLLNCPACQRIIYWVGHEAYTSAAERAKESG